MIALLITVFLNILSYGIIAPIQVELVMQTSSNINSTTYGLVLAWTNLIFFFISPVIGKLSDQLKNRKLFIVLHCFFATIVHFILFLTSFSIYSQNDNNNTLQNLQQNNNILNPIYKMINQNAFLFFFLAKTIQGTCVDITGLSYAYISDNISKENLTKYFSYILIAMGCAFSVGPIISGMITKYWNMTFAYFVNLLIAIFTLLFSYFFLKQKQNLNNTTTINNNNITDNNNITTEKTSEMISNDDIKNKTNNTTTIKEEEEKMTLNKWLKEIINPFQSLYQLINKSEPIVTFLIISKFTSCLGSSGILAVFIQYTKQQFEFTSQENGIFLTCIGLSVIIGNAILRKIMLKIFKENEYLTLLFTIFMNMIGYLFFILAKLNILFLILFIICYGFGGVEEPIRSSLIAKFSPQDCQGSVQGMNVAVLTLSKVLSPLILTFLYDLFMNVMPSISFWFTVVMYGISFVILLMFSMRQSSIMSASSLATTTTTTLVDKEK
ncbi:hypothetical protein ABK040_014328 [Willaertia magna]